MRPTVTYIYGPKGCGRKALATRCAGEKGTSDTAIVERNGETIKRLSDEHPVAFLYVTALEPPPANERILIATVIRLGAQRQAA